MSNESNTPLSNKCDILSELWMQYKNEDGDFTDYISYCDLALPIAYLHSMDLIDMNKSLEMFVDEAWDLLLSSMSIEVDAGFESLDDLFSAQE